MKKFSDFGIKSSVLQGDKVKIDVILNKLVEVVSYRIENSKFSNGKSNKCLYLQIRIEGKLHVVFSGSHVLIEQIEQVPKDGFPFSATITKPGRYYSFM